MSQRSEIDLRPETVPCGDLTEATAASRLTALAEAALALASAETPDELAAVAATAGLAALGADTAAITVVLDGRHLPAHQHLCARRPQPAHVHRPACRQQRRQQSSPIRRAEPVILPNPGCR